MNLEDVSKQLRVGDTNTIAEIVGCTDTMVSFVMSGKRNIDTKTGQKIIHVAEMIICTRNNIQNFCNEHLDNYDSNKAYMTYLNRSVEDMKNQKEGLFTQLKRQLIPCKTNKQLAR